jgi:hypothetical protein
MTQSTNMLLPVIVAATAGQQDRTGHGARDDHTGQGQAGGRHASGRHGGPSAEFTAQMEGQAHPRRGLKGGEATLRAARAAYLNTQWMGADDRRLPTGLLRRVAL